LPDGRTVLDSNFEPRVIRSRFAHMNVSRQ
jgi:hypothetical protein